MKSIQEEMVNKFRDLKVLENIIKENEGNRKKGRKDALNLYKCVFTCKQTTRTRT